jgi:hypothetical protein
MWTKEVRRSGNARVLNCSWTRRGFGRWRASDPNLPTPQFTQKIGGKLECPKNVFR